MRPTAIFSLILVVGTAVSACKGKGNKRTRGRPVELHKRFQENIGHPRVAMVIAEKIKCRQVLGPTLNRGSLPDIDEHEAILSLFVHKTQVYRFIARRGRVLALDPLSRPRLERYLIKARDELEHAGLDHHHATLAEPLKGLLIRLWEQLLSDASSHLKGVRRMLVLPHGLSKTLPFHALIRVDRSVPRGWRFLAEHYVISYSPCLALATRAPIPVERATVFVPRYGPRRRHVAGAMEEAQLIASRFSKATILDGPLASPGRFHDEISTRGAIVHFVGHGLADLEPGAGSELIFPARSSREPAQVTIKSVSRYRNRIRASLVVLAACTTAYAARFRDGKRLVADPNLVEALLAAGAPAVVAASWNVKGGQSARQMRIFYRHLSREGPARALTRAYRRSIEAIRPPHPRYWAFYATYGGWRWRGTK